MKTTFTLDPVPPFRLDLTVWVLRRRPDNTWDRWDGQTYRRVLPMPDGPLEVAVIQTGPPDAPKVLVSATGDQMPSEPEKIITAVMNRLLGLSIDLTVFYEFSAADPMLGPLVQRFRGVKPPRFLNLFEALVNGIACQQITLTLGIRLMSQLAEKYGVAMNGPETLVHAFPRAEDLAAAEPTALHGLGFSRQKVQALLALADDTAEGRLSTEVVEAMSDEAARSHLLDLRGVGCRPLCKVKLSPRDRSDRPNRYKRRQQTKQEPKTAPENTAKSNCSRSKAASRTWGREEVASASRHFASATIWVSKAFLAFSSETPASCWRRVASASKEGGTLGLPCLSL